MAQLTAAIRYHTSDRTEMGSKLTSIKRAEFLPFNTFHKKMVLDILAKTDIIYNGHVAKVLTNHFAVGSFGMKTEAQMM